MSFRFATVLIRYAAIPVIVALLRSIACDQDLVPFRLYHATSSLGLCPKPTLAKLPSTLFASDFKAVLAPISAELPSTTAMSGQRLDLGKIMTAMENAGTHESTTRLEAIRRFDEQVKQTIRSIGKLNWASQLTLDTCVHALSGIIDTLEGASKKPVPLRRATIVVAPLQDQIDAWIEGLLDQLQSFYQQTIATLNDLDSSDNHFLHIFQIPAALMDDRETSPIEYDNRGENSGWMSTANMLGINAGDVHGLVLGKAIRDFEALVKTIMRARIVISDLSNNLSGRIGEIEASYLDSGRRLVVNMDLQDQVDMTVEMLRKLKGEIEEEKLV